MIYQRQPTFLPDERWSGGGPESIATLDMCYVLHADHGMNASIFASRVTVATLSDIYSGITSAVQYA